MKYYIFFCYSETIGGGQIYENSKACWLEKNGWIPVVFTASHDYRIFKFKKREIPWKNLKRFSKLNSVFFSMPPECWPPKQVEKVLDRVEALIDRNAEQIIIESHTDYWAEWAEMLAKRLSAKNFCFLLDELLEQYGAKEFLYFKYLRGEVAGIHQTSMQRLFAGYKDISVGDDSVLRAANYGSVADVESKEIENMQKCDYNIAYVGRYKQYMENIVKGVIAFAKDYADKTINFVILGGGSELNVKKYCPPNNILITQLGFMTPIPKSFFKKVDVIIAGAGCAFISAYQNVPVIVADAGTQLANGILGYTTDSLLFSQDKPTSFDEALKSVLIERIHKNMNFSLPFINTAETVDVAYQAHLDFINKSNQEKNYFDFEKNPQRKTQILRGYSVILRWNITMLFSKAISVFRNLLV